MAGSGEVDTEALARSLRGLSVMVMGARPLEEILVEIARHAGSALPAADGVALTLLRPRGAVVAVAGDGFVEPVDAVQDRVGEGPRLDSVATGHPQVCGSLGGEARWPRFGPRAGRLGVHSALSLPLLIDGAAVGALTAYAHRRNAFCASTVAAGERFAEPAAVAVVNADSMERAARLARQFESALGSRAVIDQAIGILMSRSGGDAQAAFETLRARSQAEGTKLVDLAAGLVTQAVDRARARRSTP